jgi:hypothetical protein
MYLGVLEVLGLLLETGIREGLLECHTLHQERVLVRESDGYGVGE